MKGLILSRAADFEWFNRYQPGHPLLLPFLGRPLLLHHLDWMASRGVTEVRVLSDGPADDLSAWLDGQTLPLPVDLRPFSASETLLRLIHHQQFFTAGQPALIAWALTCFPEFLAGRQKPGTWPQTSHPGLGPLVLDSRQQLTPLPDTDWLSLTNVTDFWRVSLKLLASGPPPPLSLKHIHPAAVPTPPLLLGEGVRLGARTVAGPRLILPAGSKTGSDCRLSDTIILSPVQLGNRVELQGKVVLGTNILNPEAGGSVLITDPRILKSINRKKSIKKM